jgi:hypothetical protein
MNAKEPSGIEALLKQMPLRCPSRQLDSTIADLLSANEANPVGTSSLNEPHCESTARFGWNAILATAIAALLAGLWLGCFFLPNWELMTKSSFAAGDGHSHAEASLLPAGLFNVSALKLFHGHSQKTEFENCSLCHQQAAGDGNVLGEVFRGWFYGDKHLFEAHPFGLKDCSECHLNDIEEEDAIEKDWHQDLGKLANCSDCHKVDADGFQGFKKDWHTVLDSSEG